MTALESINDLKQRMCRSIIGQERVVERLLTDLLANGSLLLEGGYRRYRRFTPIKPER